MKPSWQVARRFAILPTAMVILAILNNRYRSMGARENPVGGVGTRYASGLSTNAQAIIACAANGRRQGTADYFRIRGSRPRKNQMISQVLDQLLIQID